MEYIKQYLKNGDVLYASNVDYIENGLVIAYNALTNHLNDFNNPHKITLPQLGINVSAADINQLLGIKSNVQAQLNNLNNLIGSTSVKSQIDAALATVTDLIIPITDKEIDGICGATLSFDDLLTDDTTGITYKLYVDNGDLKMMETDSTTTSGVNNPLTDNTTGIAYTLYVSNGDLKMTEAI